MTARRTKRDMCQHRDEIYAYELGYLLRHFGLLLNRFHVSIRNSMQNQINGIEFRTQQSQNLLLKFHQQKTNRKHQSVFYFLSNAADVRPH